MRDAVSNMELLSEIKDALVSLAVDIDVIAGLEPDAALGNVAWGVWPPASWKSMATVDIPAYGYVSATSTAFSASRWLWLAGG